MKDIFGVKGYSFLPTEPIFAVENNNYYQPLWVLNYIDLIVAIFHLYQSFKVCKSNINKIET